MFFFLKQIFETFEIWIMNETEWSQIFFQGQSCWAQHGKPSEAAVVTLEKAAFQYKGGPSLDDRPVVEEIYHGTEHSNTA